jgi:hypothetical protein
MVDDSSLLKELEKSGHISSYKHLAPNGANSSRWLTSNRR